MGGRKHCLSLEAQCEALERHAMEAAEREPVWTWSVSDLPIPMADLSPDNETETEAMMAKSAFRSVLRSLRSQLRRSLETIQEGLSNGMFDIWRVVCESHGKSTFGDDVLAEMESLMAWGHGQAVLAWNRVNSGLDSLVEQENVLRAGEFESWTSRNPSHPLSEELRKVTSEYRSRLREAETQVADLRAALADHEKDLVKQGTAIQKLDKKDRVRQGIGESLLELHTAVHRTATTVQLHLFPFTDRVVDTLRLLQFEQGSLAEHTSSPARRKKTSEEFTLSNYREIVDRDVALLKQLDNTVMARRSREACGETAPVSQPEPVARKSPVLRGKKRALGRVEKKPSTQDTLNLDWEASYSSTVTTQCSSPPSTPSNVAIGMETPSSLVPVPRPIPNDLETGSDHSPRSAPESSMESDNPSSHASNPARNTPSSIARPRTPCWSPQSLGPIRVVSKQLSSPTTTRPRTSSGISHEDTHAEGVGDPLLSVSPVHSYTPFTPPDSTIPLFRPSIGNALTASPRPAELNPKTTKGKAGLVLVPIKR
eukprot:Sspe_Gene.34400::Locus_16724_Transcript_1_2_Confidence_0.800_Length_1714::g.34400::m.34400